MTPTRDAGPRGLRLEHVALWVRDLEAMRDFYAGVLGGDAGPPYENPARGFRSVFITFGTGRVELMAEGPRAPAADGAPVTGYAHVALSAGSREAVDALVARLAARGVPILGAPRTTGDGYYEAVIADPEGNRIEVTA